MKIVGMVNPSATIRSCRSNPLIPPFRWMSRTKQAMRPPGPDARNSRADANDSTAYPPNRTTRLRARRMERSSSTMDTITFGLAIIAIVSRTPYSVTGSTAYWTLVHYRGWRTVYYAYEESGMLCTNSSEVRGGAHANATSVDEARDVGCGHREHSHDDRWVQLGRLDDEYHDEPSRNPAG